MGFGAGQYKKRLIILHVEDQLDFFHVIRQVLEQMPGEFSVLHARTYAEAIELAGKYYFDCIFIDINLPDGNGLDLFAEIKGLHPHARGVIVSGANEEEFVGMAGAVGIDAYLIKPVQLGALYDTLKNLFPEAFEKAQMAGSLTALSLVDLIQVKCIQRRASVVVATMAEKEGVIYIDERGIYHAETAGLSGLEAFNVMISWKSGQFKVLKEEFKPERTIFNQWEQVLLDAIRQADEQDASDASKA